MRVGGYNCEATSALLQQPSNVYITEIDLVFGKLNRASFMIVILWFSLYKIEAFLGEKFQGPNGCNWDLGFLGLVSVLS